MKQIVFTLVSFIFLLGQDSQSRQLINRIIDKIYLNQFSTARSIADSLYNHNQGFGQLYRLTITHVKNLDDETIDQNRIDSFFKNVESSINQLETEIDNEETAEKLFLIGNTYFLYAAEENRLKNYYSAYRHSKTGRAYLEEALELNPNWSDVKLSLGLYMYWKSIKAEDMFFISLFFVDEATQGIEHINDAIQNGHISELSGKHQLVSVLLQEKRFDEALNLATELTKKYPSSRPLMIALGESQRKNNLWKEALNTYQELLDYYIKTDNHYNSCQVLHKLVLCHVALGNKQEALNLIAQFNEIPISEENYNRLEKRTEEMLELAKSVK